MIGLTKKEQEALLLIYKNVTNYSQAKDIDVFLIFDKRDINEVNREIEKIQKTLPKKLHVIKTTKEDFIKNINVHNESMIEIVKTAIVLYGYDEYMEVINGFASF